MEPMLKAVFLEIETSASSMGIKVEKAMGYQFQRVATQASCPELSNAGFA